MVERLEIPSLTSGRDNTFFDVRFYRGLWLESDEEKIYCPLTAKRSLCPRSEQQRARKERPHKSGQAAFKAIMSEDIDWKPFAAFPPPACLAVVVGEPSEKGPYMIRVKVPGGVKLMPHRHPEDRVYTVISGVFYIGLGDEFDADKLEAYAPGTVIVLPGNTSHFHWAKSGEYITQVTGIGPLGIDYVNAKDDPRNTQPG